ncbi:PhyH-domain-containing protein [Backusella circina FSU 941]|nr:PhyH-domain-containing protein [Backusella circina FSU 941]
MSTIAATPRSESYNLTAEQIQSYNDNGFLLIQDFFSPKEHKALESYCTEFQNWGKEKGKWMQYYEVNTSSGESQLCRTENFTPYHDGMNSYVRSPRLLEVLKRLHGEEYVLFKEKVNYKLPGGGGFPAHQDAPAFVQFGQASHMTVMFTIDPTTDANGCLQVVPGSHKNDYERRILPQEKHDGSISTEWCEKHEWTPVYCQPGSVLIFGAYLAHRSGDNTTEKSRKAVYLTYNASSEGDLRDHYYDEKRKLFPPSYEREEGKDYSEGAIIYNLATPIRS